MTVSLSVLRKLCEEFDETYETEGDAIKVFLYILDNHEAATAEAEAAKSK